MIRGAVRRLFLTRLSVSRKTLLVKSGATDFAVAGFVAKFEVGSAEVDFLLNWVVWICFNSLGCWFLYLCYFGLALFTTLLWAAIISSIAVF